MHLVRTILPEDNLTDTPVSRYPSTASNIVPQTTGQSTTTLDAAYEGVFSQLDALASQNLALNSPSASTPTSSVPIPAPSFLYSRPFGTGAADLSPLEALSERTEPLSSSASIRSSTGTIGPKSGFSSTSIARRFPLPGSPSKGLSPTSGPSTKQSMPQASPKKASDLIKMFEQRGSAPPPQPSFAPAVSRTSAFAAISREPSASPPPLVAIQRPLQSLFDPIPAPISSPTATPALPPSAYRPPAADIPLPGPTTPPKSPSPLSQVRTMIASWKARAGSPTQRVVGSAGKGGDTPRLFGRDRSWNVSIRRRKRHEGEGATLGETGEEPDVSPTSKEPEQPEALLDGNTESNIHEEQGSETSWGGTSISAAKSRSVKSSKSEAKTLTGDVSH